MPYQMQQTKQKKLEFRMQAGTGTSSNPVTKCFLLPLLFIILICSIFPASASGQIGKAIRHAAEAAAKVADDAAKATKAAKKLPDDTVARRLGKVDSKTPPTKPSNLSSSNKRLESEFRELDTSLERLPGPTDALQIQHNLELRLLETGKSPLDEVPVSELKEAIEESKSLASSIESNKKIVRDLLKSDLVFSQIDELKRWRVINAAPEQELLLVPELIRRTEIEDSLLSGLPGHEEFLNKAREMKLLTNQASQVAPLASKSRVMRLAAEAFTDVSRNNSALAQETETDREATIRSIERMDKILSWKLARIGQLRSTVMAAESYIRLIGPARQTDTSNGADIIFGKSTVDVSDRVNAWDLAIDAADLLVKQIISLSERLYKADFKYEYEFDEIVCGTMSGSTGLRLSDLHIDIAVLLVRSGHSKRAHEWITNELANGAGLERVRDALNENPKRLGFTPMKPTNFESINIRTLFEREFAELERSILQLETYLIVEAVAVHSVATQRLKQLNRQFNVVSQSPVEKLLEQLTNTK